MLVVYRHRHRLGLREQLATYHFLSGLAGTIISLLVAPALLAQVGQAQVTPVRLMLLATIMLFASVMAVGVALFSARPGALAWAAIAQVIQIPVLNVPLMKWSFFAGGYLAPYWVWGQGLGTRLGLKAAMDVGWRQDAPYYVGLNLVPLVVLWLLDRCRQRELSGTDAMVGTTPTDQTPSAASEQSAPIMLDP